MWYYNWSAGVLSLFGRSRRGSSPLSSIRSKAHINHSIIAIPPADHVETGNSVIPAHDRLPVEGLPG